uniref:Uncharacterized protein n=2 Tax=Equus TaxID=9789 RepID=A0A3Q2IBH9_HORSE
MASWSVQKCSFRHSCTVLHRDLEVNNRQMLSVPVGSQLKKIILTGSYTRKQLAPLTT